MLREQFRSLVVNISLFNFSRLSKTVMPLLNLSPLQLTLTAGKYTGNVILPFVHIWHRDRKFVPPVDSPLLLMSVSDLAEKIRQQEVTSVDLVMAYVERILDVDPILKAVMDERFDEALEEAQKADELCKSIDKETLKKTFPLLGVPFTVKEMVGVTGLSQTVGALSRKGLKCEKEGLAIRNLRLAGAIPLCVTNVPEWCMSWETQNLIVGQTVNPYNTLHSPGGSSGGEAALLGCGASLFGVGSDFIGSCRLPAMFCGVFGHRPTRPFVSMEGPILLFQGNIAQDILTLGPMTRYACDLPIVLGVMCGPESTKFLKLEEEVDVRALNVLYSTKFSHSTEDLKFDPEITNALTSVRTALSYVGATVKEADLSFEGMFETLFARIMEIDNSTMIEKSEIPSHWGSCLKEYLKWMFGRSNHTLFAIHSQVFMRNKRYFPKDTRNLYKKRLDILKNQVEVSHDSLSSYQNVLKFFLNRTC